MNYAVIVAGGKGLRMGTDLPKQFLPIGGRPVLMHTLEAFARAVPGICLILVLPADQQDFWRDLCVRHTFTLPHTIATGGETRFHSVLNGLKAIDEALSPQERREGLVGVHDGVRPFVSVDVIRRCFDTARVTGAAVPVIPVVETVREITSPLSPHCEEGALTAQSVTRDRNRYRLVQTPQTFQLSLLRLAYEQPYRPAFTDDASVVEALGHPITLVEGNRENIKITTPFDLVVAEAMMRKGPSHQKS
ncbi:MAG: 2-C-methyl-D-erythritol 4-phosphate cytidylyltransferase [Bacteroidaceae bacterium]|nr:2-C-methyl-D-erythritol 4-phosphate cytidylyltransferase [Bacteroidaceae bacterium]